MGEAGVEMGMKPKEAVEPPGEQGLGSGEMTPEPHPGPGQSMVRQLRLLSDRKTNALLSHTWPREPCICSS